MMWETNLAQLCATWRLAIASVRVGESFRDYTGAMLTGAWVTWLDESGQQRETEYRLGRTAEEAVEHALLRASLESRGLWPVVREEADDDADDDAEDDGDCYSCGGSGGGDPPMVCRSCGGSGRSRW